jgi:hypothetical protein
LGVVDFGGVAGTVVVGGAVIVGSRKYGSMIIYSSMFFFRIADHMM